MLMLSFCQRRLIFSLTLSLLLLTAVACGSAAAPQELALDLRVADGKLVPDTVAARQGDTITLRIESDRAGAIHFHGYDIEHDLAVASTTDFQFVAGATGRFPITFHDAPGDATPGAGHHSDHQPGHQHSAAAAQKAVAAPDDHGHDGHGEMDHRPVESETPVSVAIGATVEEGGGVKVQIMTEGWNWAPEAVNLEPTPGAGHAHIYVNGEKVGRVYGPYHYLSALEPGRHEIKVNLNDNRHNPLTWQGELVEMATMVTIPESGPDSGHDHHRMPDPAPAEAPVSLELIVHPDALSGYNLQVIPAGFAFADQGYGQLSIDGEPVTRIYTPWFQLPALEPGSHTIDVALLDNAGRPYRDNGQPVAASVSVLEPAMAGDAPAGGMAATAAGDHSDTHHESGAAADAEAAELELGFLVVSPR